MFSSFLGPPPIHSLTRARSLVHSLTHIRTHARTHAHLKVERQASERERESPKERQRGGETWRGKGRRESTHNLKIVVQDSCTEFTEEVQNSSREQEAMSPVSKHARIQTRTHMHTNMRTCIIRVARTNMYRSDDCVLVDTVVQRLGDAVMTSMDTCTILRLSIQRLFDYLLSSVCSSEESH